MLRVRERTRALHGFYSLETKTRLKRTPVNALLIAAGNAAAVIIALAVFAWFTLGR
jgi:hypothetical protein